MSLFSYLLKETEFKALARFVSPSFFSVIPVGETCGVISNVIRSSRDANAMILARNQVAKVMTSQIKILESVSSPGLNVSAQLGEQILQAYFRQILFSPVWLLDFRKERWELSSCGLLWAPAPYFHRPSENFLKSVRALYRGFYQGKGEEFDHALSELGIIDAKAEILSHFGLGDQSLVSFSLSEFQATFSHVFESCRAGGSRIHPEFALLGAMLVSLYESLQPVTEGINVRHCFSLADSQS